MNVKAKKVNLKNLLEAEHSKRQTLKIARIVSDDQKKFDELISFCFGLDEKLAQRSSWPLLYCIKSYPLLVSKHLKRMIQQLRKPVHNAVRRNFIYVFNLIEIPAKYESDLISVCFDFLNAKDEFVAIKCYAMSLLAKFCLKYPDLKIELKASIETQLPFETAAFKSRGRHTLRLLR